VKALLKEGEKVDEMLHLTLAVAGVVFPDSRFYCFWFCL